MFESKIFMFDETELMGYKEKLYEYI